MDEKTITAYSIKDEAVPHWPIRQARKKREWMETNNRHAYRCLPLVVANHAGWVIDSPATFTATWDGDTGYENAATSIKLDFAPDTPAIARADIVSDFGNGILTFNVPYLFQTPPDMGLEVRGVPNRWKDGAVALDGFVETDWLPFPFTMNWRLTRPNLPVQFEKGEPICYFFVRSLGDSAELSATIQPLASNEQLKEAYRTWAFSRYVNKYTDDPALSFLKNRYIKGKDFEGKQAANHNKAIKLATFQTYLPAKDSEETKTKENKHE